MSPFLRLNYTDLSRGIAISVLAAVLTYFSGVLSSPTFSFTAIDWNEIIKLATITGISYLVKNVLSDESGKLLGKI